MRRLLLELKIAGINFPLVTAALSLALVLFAALAGELEQLELPQGWVWAGAKELREVYALPNAFQSFTPQVSARLGAF